MNAADDGGCGDDEMGETTGTEGDEERSSSMTFTHTTHRRPNERRHSFELATLIQAQVRQQVVQEFLQACGDDEEKQAIVRELAQKVLQEAAVGGGTAGGVTNHHHRHHLNTTNNTTTTAADAMSLGEEVSEHDHDSGDEKKRKDDESDDDDDDDDSESRESESGEDEESNDDDDDDDNNKKNDHKWEDMDSIDEIEESPYEAGASAEVGERIFEKFQRLLEPVKTPASRRRSSSAGTLVPTKAAIERLGSEQARAMVTAYFHIAQSGMLYSPLWLEGKIRNVQVEGLKRPMLLMCLQEQRCSRTEVKGVLTKLVEDLRLASIIQEAIDDWDLEDQFPNLASCRRTSSDDTTFSFPYDRSYRTVCQKCELFAARAFACMNFLKRKSIKGSVAKKVLACLGIMEQHLDSQEGNNANSASTSHGAGHPRHIQVPNSPQTAGGTRTTGGNDQQSIPSRAAARGRSPLHRPKHGRSASSPRRRGAPTKTGMAVEQLDLQTGQVLAFYPSHRDATESVGLKSYSCIRDVVKGRHNSSGGFLWREVGSNDLPVGVDAMEEDSPTMTVEQLHLQTGQVVASYPSYKAAADCLGLKSVSSILDVLSGRRKAGGGFFWRNVGSSDLPKGMVDDDDDDDSDDGDGDENENENEDDQALGSPWTSAGMEQKSSPSRVARGLQLLPETTNHDGKAPNHSTSSRGRGRKQTPVEQLDLNTGQVLASYQSHRDATETVGLKFSSSILDVVKGRTKSAGGFFWRKVGSSDLPAGVDNTEEDTPAMTLDRLDLHTGKVLTSYPSHEAAADILGLKSSSSILDVVAGRRKAGGGFFWRKAGSSDLPEGILDDDDESDDSLVVTNSPRRTVGNQGTDTEEQMSTSRAAQGALLIHMPQMNNDRTVNDFSPRRVQVAKQMAVEQLDLQTGQVLASFESHRDATESVGLKSYNSIPDVIKGRNKSAGGFFWRKVVFNDLPEGRLDDKDDAFQGPTTARTSCINVTSSFPESSPSRARQETITSENTKGIAMAGEQLNLHTGQVLASHPSQRATAKSVGLKLPLNGISDATTVRSKEKPVGGSFWRKVGSSDLPEGVSVDSDENTDFTRVAFPGEKQSKPLKNSEARLIHNDKQTRSLSPPANSIQVEQLDLEGGKVLASFQSISAANVSIGRKERHPSIRDVVNGKQKATGGFFWRLLGSINLPERSPQHEHESVDSTEAGSQLAKEKSTDKQQSISGSDKSGPVPVPVEKLDLNTGEVLACFPSIGRASSSHGVHQSSIRKVLSGESKSCGGFFWRRAASITPSDSLQSQVGYDHQAPASGALRELARAASIEKLDPQSGEVLALYSSIREANISLGKKPNNSGIGECLAGRQIMSSGFLWRKAPPFAPVDRVMRDDGRQPGNRASVNLEMTQNVDTTPRLEKLSAGGRIPSVTEDLDTHRDVFPGKRPRDETEETDSSSRKQRRTDEEIHSEAREDISSRGTQKDLLSELAVDMSKIPAIDKTDVISSKGNSSMRAISALNDIVDSPYQENATAEVGEEMFEFFKMLLLPQAGVGRRQAGASDPAIKVFGESLAQTVIDASTKIAISGMVYSKEWSEGLIRGKAVGSIPKSVLLLLLQEQRLARPGVLGVLIIVVIDFELCKIMTKALLEWNLAGKFSKISQVATHSAFTTKQAQCFKCLVFIARVYHCMAILKLKTMTESIQRKVEACLQILEANFGNRSPRGQDTGVVSPMHQGDEAIDDDSSDDDAFHNTCTPKDITKTSHVLFQQPISLARIEEEAELPGALPKAFGDRSSEKGCASTDSLIQRRVATKMASKVPNTHSHPLDQKRKAATGGLKEDQWFPYDSNKEVVLTPGEVETAWLVEEGIYCLRNREINWRFVYKYASPTLRVELRKSSVNRLENCVRLQDSIVSERFGQLRKKIRRSLLKGSMRERMKDKIPKERLASRQAKIIGSDSAPQQGVP